MRTPWLLSSLFLFACGDATVLLDGGVDANVDAAILCESPDTVCPEAQPVAGAPCEGDLSCDYDQGRSLGIWTYTCESGAWEPGAAPCSELPGGGCAAPPLAERCRSPFAGSMPVTVSIGPAGAAAFRAFEANEMVEPITGGQGLSMIELRLAIEGADGVGCATTSITLEHEGTRTDPVVSDLEFHCGETRRVFVILPGGLDCSEPTADIGVDVEVTGLGTVHVDLVLDTSMLCLLG